MKIPIEELEQALKGSEKKTKYELFLDENKDTILAMIKKGYSDLEIAKAINIYLAKINKTKREMRKKGEKIDENLRNIPAIIPKKVINKYLKQLRKKIDEQNENNNSKTIVKDSIQDKSTKVVKEEDNNDKSNDNNKDKDILKNRKTANFSDI